MRTPEPPLTPKAREAAAVKAAVDLIRSRVKTEDAYAGSADPLTPPNAEYGEEFATAFIVRSQVNAMQNLLANTDEESPYGNKQQNRQLLGKAVEQIQALQDTLGKIPAGAKSLIFSEEYEGSDRYILADMAERARKSAPRLYHFVAALQSVKTRCEMLAESAPGEHGSTDYPSRLAAMCAANILEDHGVRPTRGNDAQPSTFEQLASLLYEAATGESSKDCARACRDELNRRKALQ